MSSAATSSGPKKPRAKLSLPVLQGNFPRRFSRPRDVQTEMLGFIARHGASIIEAPTGTGKTAVEAAILQAAQSKGGSPLFLLVPNKTILQQIAKEYPELRVALGRNEHECLYYEDSYQADEVPCSLLGDCPHRVNQDTGQTHEPGAEPCPYLQQKFDAKKGDAPVLATMAFYLFTRLFSREFDVPDWLVIDEAHRIAEVVRNVLSYDISDHHLEVAADRLESIAPVEANILRKFRRRMIQMMKARKKFEPRQGTLLDNDELLELIQILSGISTSTLSAKVSEAMRFGALNAMEDRVILKQLETLIRDLRRYVRSFEYSLGTDDRQPLSYTYAYYEEERGEGKKVQYKLVIKSYYVVPLIQKMASPNTVCLSATIGDPEMFGHETGFRSPFLSAGKHFPAGNTRIFMSTDTPNLATRKKSNREPTRVLRRIAKACRTFARKGHRSLVVTVSNAERQKFIDLAIEEGVNVLSYGDGITPKEAAERFKDGEGDVLVGTEANYAEGVDLPKSLAPVIFVLRPGYPNPKDPTTVFEERRFGSARWKLWNYRVMLKALQVRGRNVRSMTDVGVTFFISQQYRRFVFASLPEALQQSYVGDKTFDENVAEALEVLG